MKMRTMVFTVCGLFMILPYGFASGVSTSTLKVKKVIAYYVGCEDKEVISDIEYSIKSIASYANDNKIAIKKINNKECGYTLIFGEKRKLIESAQTDVDLIEICNIFFKLKK